MFLFFTDDSLSFSSQDSSLSLGMNMSRSVYWNDNTVSPTPSMQESISSPSSSCSSAAKMSTSTTMKVNSPSASVSTLPSLVASSPSTSVKGEKQSISAGKILLNTLIIRARQQCLAMLKPKPFYMQNLKLMYSNLV